MKNIFKILILFTAFMSTVSAHAGKTRPSNCGLMGCDSPPFPSDLQMISSILAQPELALFTAGASLTKTEIAKTTNDLHPEYQLTLTTTTGEALFVCAAVGLLLDGFEPGGEAVTVGNRLAIMTFKAGTCYWPVSSQRF